MECFLFGLFCQGGIQREAEASQSTEGKTEDAKTCYDYKTTNLERVCGRVLTKSAL